MRYAKTFHQTVVHMFQHINNYTQVNNSLHNFQHRNNVKIKSNQQPNGTIHFNITHGKTNAEIQNSKNLQPNQTVGQQMYAVKVIEN